jgi:hypothetical protein
MQPALTLLSLQALPPEEVKALIDYQLQSGEPTRAPWWRSNQPRHSVQSKHGDGSENTAASKPLATSQVSKVRTDGLGAFFQLPTTFEYTSVPAILQPPASVSQALVVPATDGWV